MKKLSLLPLILLLMLVPLVSAQSSTHYVSRNGNNTTGESWATAWNELSRINWAVVQPGDTILVDGGTVACAPLGNAAPGCGMVYQTLLAYGKDNVTVKLGTSGTVIQDGGQSRFTYCSENGSMPLPRTNPLATVLETGVSFNGRRGATLDGTKWGGWEIANFHRYGVNFGGGGGNTVQYVKIHHVNNPADTTNNSVGVTQGWTATGDTVRFAEIYRNGQDAVRVAGDDFTLSDSYLHDHYCNHPDGIQAFVATSNADIPDAAGEIQNLTVRRSIFDKIGLQMIFLGENAAHNSWVNGALIEGNLFLRGDYIIKTKHGSSTNFVVRSNTFAGSSQFGIEWCCASPGARTPMLIIDNIFANVRNPSGTAFYVPTGGSATRFETNCIFNSGGFSGGSFATGTITANPQFITGSWSVAAGSPCAGKGASLGSVNDLVQTEAPTATPSPSPSQTASPSPTPSPTSTETPTSTPSPTVEPECWSVANGRLCFYPNP